MVTGWITIIHTKALRLVFVDRRTSELSAYALFVVEAANTTVPSQAFKMT